MNPETDIEWLDGEPPRSQLEITREARRRFVEQLRANPGRWAVVPDDVADEATVTFNLWGLLDFTGVETKFAADTWYAKYDPPQPNVKPPSGLFRWPCR